MFGVWKRFPLLPTSRLLASAKNLAGLLTKNMNPTPIEVDGGLIEGEILINDLNDEPYYSFKGVPYARPPTGSLRFQPPKSVKEWEGVRQCIEDGDACCQKLLLSVPPPTIAGSEDCLYLNIYFPVSNPSKSLRPVMVFIHGGGFQSGSADSNIYGPDFLITKDIVLVTINYRLNIFGFLNLGIEECPGNFGLLDQRAALIWVKKHIKKFSGDPNNVTICGESAGSASVSYHLLSPLSKGLFHKAIKSSGCVFDPWAYMDPEISIDRAFRIGKQLGCVTNDVKELHKFLMTVPDKQLLKVVLTIMTPEDLHTGLPFAFVPSKEICGSYEDRFLPSDPKTLLKQAPDVPVLVGLNSSEGLLIYLENPRMLSKVTENPGRVMDSMFPHDLKSLSKDHSKVALARSKVRQFYLKEGTAPENIPAQKFADFFGDITWLRGNYQWLKTCLSFSASKPISLYLFDFESDMSIIKLLPGVQVPDHSSGSCHGDDLLFLFNFRVLSDGMLESDACKQVVENMTTVWTNFAKFGNPKGHLKVDWKPLSLGRPVHCKIGQKLETQPGLIYEDRIKFWSDLQLSMLSQSKL
ncbi:unnamed protein product [Bemisia tabaci]|uniref:Carboxylesterase type B domain-containing protein n=2 Tax=Bemisia tabaci TaxID=7038 RepID=A0A9P0AK65_BEMTA|nr:unnamed protein product [Bemisia tabaci]